MSARVPAGQCVPVSPLPPPSNSPTETTDTGYAGVSSSMVSGERTILYKSLDVVNPGMQSRHDYYYTKHTFHNDIWYMNM